MQTLKAGIWTTLGDDVCSACSQISIYIVQTELCRCECELK